ncbi:MAG TPA: hypothetical protein VMZ00_13885 [Sporichthya sp.]|nr:hypothetical protein [Sporichthya sp.]
MAVTVEVTTDAVAVCFRGVDRFWALSRGLRIPLERIDEAGASPRADAKRRCPKLRLPGSYWPGRLHAGSYGWGERRQLWCVHRAQQVLAVDLHGRPYARVVVEVDDPGAVAARIEAARRAT